MIYDSILPVLMFFSPANTWKRHWTKALDLKGDKAPMQLRELYQVHLGVRDGAVSIRWYALGLRTSPTDSITMSKISGLTQLYDAKISEDCCRSHKFIHICFYRNCKSINFCSCRAWPISPSC